MTLKELFYKSYYHNSKGFLLNGDCVEMLKGIDDESIDLTVTSPPYDDMREYQDGHIFNLDNLITELYRTTKVGG